MIKLVPDLRLFHEVSFWADLEVKKGKCMTPVAYYIFSHKLLGITGNIRNMTFNWISALSLPIVHKIALFAHLGVREREREREFMIIATFVFFIILVRMYHK